MKKNKTLPNPTKLAGTTTRKRSDETIIHTQNKSPFIITICAFSDCLNALEKMLKHAISHEEMAFVIITHRNPKNIQLSSEQLQPFTQMTVLAARDQQHVQADHIYIVPPDIKVILHHNLLLVVDKTTHTNIGSPADYFLYSVAQEQGEKAICIILSGIGHAETAGLRVFKERGGLIIAQTERPTIHHDSLSKSAMYSGLVDYALLPENLYGFLLKYITHLNNKIEVTH